MPDKPTAIKCNWFWQGLATPFSKSYNFSIGSGIVYVLSDRRKLTVQWISFYHMQTSYSNLTLCLLQKSWAERRTAFFFYHWLEKKFFPPKYTYIDNMIKNKTKQKYAFGQQVALHSIIVTRRFRSLDHFNCNFQSELSSILSFWPIILLCV